MQAVILVGGQGTRLRPLTSTVPKPVVRLVDRPFIAFMLEWLRGHGIDDVIMSCGFLADGVRKVLGDGSRMGIRLRFVEEPDPRGTAGALKLAEPMLDERFLMLNGDVLTDIDLTAQIAQHERSGARATLALVPVADPSAYGLVILREDRSVSDFVEKPSADSVESNLISAGAYVLEREILGLVPPERNVSIEREVWPLLIDDGLYGYPSESYWLDIGTPARYLQGTFDILAGNVHTAVSERLGDELSRDRRGRQHGWAGDPTGRPRPRRARGGGSARGQSRGARAGRVRRGGLDGGAGGRARGHPDRRELRAARLHHRGRLPGGRGHDDQRGGRARRRRARGGAQRDHARGAYLPWCRVAGRRDRVLGLRSRGPTTTVRRMQMSIVTIPRARQEASST